jgi:alkylation response protein AidB-like acyl-CoA dehydrogenase
MSDEARFFQEAPVLTDTYEGDHSLRLQLRRLLGPAVMGAVEPSLKEMGARAVGELLGLAARSEGNPPRLVQYGPYGRRVDRIEVEPAWLKLGEVAAEAGIIALPYERAHGWRSRVHQFALLTLYTPSSAFFSCPLAMSDGAVAALKKYGDGEYARRAIQHLTSRDPAAAWTSGQWMTEKEGGSDVSRSSTVARLEGEQWRLYGTKYFTSATTSQCTLTLARPEGAEAGSRGLSMFYLEPWRADGSANGIEVRRLKDKLGSKALPTAELELCGAVAHPVGGIGDGIRKITTVLNIARYFNTNAAVASMRRALDLSLAYAKVREAFGRRLIELPLHVETLAMMQVEYDAALAVGLRLAELLGKVEGGEASAVEEGTWRLLTPLAKLGTGKQCVAVASEALEAFGGAGYVEDTGVPILLRDAQVLPIWEGTTNVLSLDALRAMARDGALEALLADLEARLAPATRPALAAPVAATRAAAQALGAAAAQMARGGEALAQVGARGFALSLYRAYAAALLCEAAQWELDQEGTGRLAVAAARWCEAGLLRLIGVDAAREGESLSLLMG